MEESSLGPREKDEVVTVDFHVRDAFPPSEYGVEATVSGDEGRLLGRTKGAITFEIVAEELAAGAVIQPPTRGRGPRRRRAGPGHLRPVPARVTVVIPNWNGERFLDLCLGSLRNRSFRDFETIVVDNGSTDGSIDFVKKDTFPM